MTLRGPEGDPRVVTLADRRRELDRVADGPSDAAAEETPVEEPETIDKIVATVVAELPIVPVATLITEPVGELVVPESRADTSAEPAADAASAEEQRARRRRGRRGGRRGKRPGERGPTPAEE